MKSNLHLLRRVAFQFFEVTGRAKIGSKTVKRPAPKPASQFTLNSAGLASRGVAALLILFLTGPCLAKDVPYRGQADGQITESTFLAEPAPGGGPFLRETARAVGSFTHVGLTEISLEWEISLAAIESELVFMIEGRFSLTTASGDSMEGRFVSMQGVNSPESVIEVSVENGTGRFRDATGVIPGFGLRNGAAFKYELNGRLRY